MSKVSACLASVLKLKDEEATEIMTLAAKLRADDPTHSEETSVRDAVKHLIGQMSGVTPEVGRIDPIRSLAAGLTGSPTSATQVAERIGRESSGGFTTRVNAALAAGKITKNQSESLLEMASSDARGMAKAKDELVRLDEKHAQRMTAEKAAGKVWEDPDFSWQEGDPKWKDLTPQQRTTWAEAVKTNKATGELFDHIAQENKNISEVPKVDDTDDISTQRITNPDRAQKDLIDPSNSAFKDGKSSAEWLSRNAAEPFQRAVAKRLMAMLDNTAVNLQVTPEDTSVSPHIRAIFEQGRFKALSAINRSTGVTTVYAPKGDNLNASTLLHELVHAATQKALRMDPDLHAEAESLQVALARTLNQIADDPRVGENFRDEAGYFGTAINDADELMAYAFSSPTLQKYLQMMTAEGRPTTSAQKESDAKTRVTASLWDRFIDIVRAALGIDPVFKPKLAEALQNAEAERAAFLADNLTPRLMDRLDSIFQRAMDGYSATVDEPLSNRPTNISRARAATAAAIDKAKTDSSGMQNDVPRQKVKEATNVQGGEPSVKGLNLPDFEPRSGIATTIKDWSGGWRNKPGMLGWLTLRQIADRFKDVPGVARFTDLSQQMGAKTKALMVEAHAVDLNWDKLTKTESTDMQRLMVESTMEQLWPDQSATSTANTKLINGDAIKATKHADLAKRHAALSETAKLVYKEAEAKMRKDWDARGVLLRKNIVDQYKAELHTSAAELDRLAALGLRERPAALKGLSRAEQRSVNSMWGDLDEHAERLAQMQGPYFPLMRFGDHAVVAKSLDYTEAATALENAQEHLDALNQDDDSTPERLARAREAVISAKAAVEDLKDSERHYIVEFYESPSEAQDRHMQLSQHFTATKRPMSVYTERREEYFGKLDAVAPSFMKKLQESLTNNLPDKDATAIRQAIRDMYIQSMPERSALKQQLRRLNVKGVKVGEMRRSFAAASMRSSWHLSRLEFGAPMAEQLALLKSGDTDDQRVVGGELARRLASSFQQDNANQFATTLLNGASAISYMTYLGASPSFFIMNAVQPFIISLPIMAGKYGLKRSTAELGSAWQDVAKAMASSLKEQKNWKFTLDLEKFNADNGERAMLYNLFNKGIIDVTIEHDLGSVAGGNDTTAIGKAMSYATLPAHHTEVINRVSTALAAYRLAKSSGLTAAMTNDEAVKYAESVVADTHLDYSPENAPRFMRSTSLGGLGRIVFQFKKYMQGMIYLNSKLLRDSFGTGPQAAESRKGFMYLMAMQLAVSGAVGLPVAFVPKILSGIISAFYPPDDQPELYQALYAGFKDALGETAARALFKGLPAALGVDVSGKVGQGGLLNPLAFMPEGKKGADYMAYAALSLAGPAASMAANWVEGISIAGQDPVKAAQKILPRFLADPIRAVDRANRGVTNKRGDTIMQPEDFTSLDLFLRGIGFEGTKVTDMYDARGAMVDAKSGRDDVRKAIIHDAAIAKAKGEAVDQDKINAFNDRHPEKGNRITNETINASVKTSRVTAQQLRDGVRVRKQDRELADRLGLQPARGMQ